MLNCTKYFVILLAVTLVPYTNQINVLREISTHPSSYELEASDVDDLENNDYLDESEISVTDNDYSDGAPGNGVQVDESPPRGVSVDDGTNYDVTLVDEEIDDINVDGVAVDDAEVAGDTVDSVTDTTMDDVAVDDVLLDDVTVDSDALYDISGYTIVTVPIFLAVGLFGNTLSIMVMKRQVFKTYTIRYIIIALATSDIIVICMQPFIKKLFLDLIRVDFRNESLLFCKFFYWLWRSAKFTSSWFVVLIALERFVAVCLPLRAKTIIIKRNVMAAILIVYAVIGGFVLSWDVLGTEILDGVCRPNRMSQNRELEKAYVVIGNKLICIPKIASCDNNCYKSRNLFYYTYVLFAVVG